MVYKNLNYLLIFIIFILSELLNIVVYGQQLYVPKTRVGHAAVRFIDVIYYIGGFDINYAINLDPISDFFYLDVGTSDNFLKWTDLKSQGVKLPTTIWHSAHLGGGNQDLIFIVGGLHYDQTNTDYVYIFDTKTNELNIPTVIKGNVPPRRKGINSVIYEGKIYMFGGHMGIIGNYTFFNNFDIFDTINLNWQVGRLVDSPTARTLYTATLVNGVIYYIGGTQQNIFTPMTEIYQYDIVKNKWSLKKATTIDTTTPLPGIRAGHSAVQDNGKIYIYGGFYSSENTLFIPSQETFVILDAATLVWSIPELKDPNIPKLAFHTATLTMLKFMVISFGNRTDLPNEGDQSNKSNYVFDLDDPYFSWIQLSIASEPPKNMTKTPPVTTSGDKTEPQEPSSSNKIVIISVSIGSIAIILAIYVAFSLVYKRIKTNTIKAGEKSGHSDENSVNEVRV
ncbi:hypothetical protein C1645_831535 [Glomus cerebriforme]|uniref:Attractin/MKLN-like beta-propeller domain-containing protein n=1 Tax=Glomus cerebriforme TaxID=658196 RepID=A0A397SFC8_9GLOM|nr:hypothetical protein C1645_831535 [Glomus cerebriforme]